MLALLVFLGCLIALLVLWQSAGWSWHRLDRRRAYWCMVGLALASAVWCRDAFPGSAAAIVLAAAAGLGLLWGFWSDWQR